MGGALSLFQALHYRLPSTAKGRALYYAKHLQTRPSIKFQEKLLNLVDADFIAAVKGSFCGTTRCTFMDSNDNTHYLFQNARRLLKRPPKHRPQMKGNVNPEHQFSSNQQGELFLFNLLWLLRIVKSSKISPDLAEHWADALWKMFKVCSLLSPSSSPCPLICIIGGPLS